VSRSPVLEAFDKQVEKCLRIYRTFLSSPASGILRAVEGDRESWLLTGLITILMAVFATTLYICLER